MLEHSVEHLAVGMDYRQRLLATMMYRALGNFDVVSLAASHYRSLRLNSAESSGCLQSSQIVTLQMLHTGVKDVLTNLKLDPPPNMLGQVPNPFCRTSPQIID